MVRPLVLVALAGFCIVLCREADRTWGAPEEMCMLKEELVDESSGVAPSQIASGVFYTHNDSGDTARFFRFKRDGSVDGIFTLPGAKAVDWEDMASATVDGKPYLYFGDVGDNGEERETVTVYRVPEPTVTGTKTIDSFDTYTLKYPDKAHNCEALFVTKAGDVWVVTKDPGGISKAFVLKAPKSDGAYTLKHVADIEVDTGGMGGKLVTGGDISPDGKFVVLRTYTAAFEYAVPADFDGWTKSEPTFVRTAIELQGEAVCYSKDGRYMVTTSEFSPCPVSVMALQGP